MQGNTFSVLFIARKKKFGNQGCGLGHPRLGGGDVGVENIREAVSGGLIKRAVEKEVVYIL